jgi:hypothetical protein
LGSPSCILEYMSIGQKTVRIGKRSTAILRRVFFTLGALMLFVRDELAEDVQDIVANARLFVGIALTLIGTLSFTSDKYCDGAAANYYTCTRPATYYYYPWWAVLLVVIGSFFVVLWFLRRKHS